MSEEIKAIFSGKQKKAFCNGLKIFTDYVFMYV